MQRAAVMLSIVLLMSACSASRPGTIDRPGTDADGKVRFAVVGDMPYSDEEDSLLTVPTGDIARAIRDYNAPVLIHLGDFKSGGSSCTDSLFVARRNQIANLMPFKTVYTPGDNDWTDCDREGMSLRFDELERLAYLHTLFYQGEGLAMTRDIPDIIRQEGFVENVMWSMQGLVFGTLHVPGTNNGRDEILLSDKDMALDQADRRDAFNEAWAEKLFETAASAPALVILFQADIYRPDVSKSYQECTTQHREDCDGYKRIRDFIERKAALYKKPVLIVHGDTNAYCFHQPAEGLALNLWRLNAPGDYKLIDAAQVTFDPGNTETPFQALTLWKPTVLPKVCDYSR